MSFIAASFSTIASAANTPIVLRGRFGGDDLVIGYQNAAIDTPLVLFGLLTTLLITGAIFVSLEVRMEARDRKV